LVIDLSTAAVLEATGKDSIPKSDWPNIAMFVPQRQREQIKENEWFELLKSHSRHRIFIEHIQEAPEKATVLFRSLHCWDFGRAHCLNDALYIYSQWDGYWETDSFKPVRNWLKRHDIPKIDIHTSGHASPADLQKFTKALNPKKVVPIHSFEPERYRELFENVEIHKDGEPWPVE
jgi:ribonuclease J